MARTLDKEKARKLRAKGKSYSEIKQALGISKSTLSNWLNDMPLSAKQIRELRDFNPRRIEHFRETMQRKREARLDDAFIRVRRDIGRLSKRDLFIGGLYLYWGEGTKSDRGAISIANTDPSVIRAFLDWSEIMRIRKGQMRVRLHLYTDMNIERETLYWSKQLSMPLTQFRKPHIKNSSLAGLTYKTGHGHGTCNVRFGNIAMWEYITMALKHIREQHSRP
jgi:transcriptional regulator with XRE-family HTH domain